jgi:hypothetical protein
VAGEMQDGYTVNEGVLYVGLRGHHHLYPQVTPQVFLNR